ncbi:J domain-containing protein [Ancylobacter pratisalsi]|uniref:J domain-containing protein n=1 Tax=Ancylobacter pratisalsi TaxID=1745854 RepID=A0A6P1YIX7_9HYPH|nr:J domain-containing protein [Ancylobacter pratisalsi]QIB33259.1 J domain-containing protein [Ancylobacter pratisalsi]
MKFDSPIFDRIRVKPNRDRTVKAEGPVCEWHGCTHPATHRAPKGRDREGQFWRYCFDHVRAYNQSYNYFSGMPDEDVMAYQKDAMTGHRPTWKMGSRGAGAAREAHARQHQPEGFADPFGMFGEMGGTARPEPEPPRENRMIRNAERRAFESLGVEISATPQEIKARFKILVKKYHPDANGGDISTEDRLRDVIQAYNHLKNAGYC